MFPAPPDAVAVRAASTELPSSALHTGRPVAKFRKCVPIGFGAPDVWYSVASGSVKSQVPVAWQVYFCTPIAWATRNSRLSGAYVRGSSASPGAVCGAGAADAAAVTRPHNARTVAQATIKREKRCFVVMEFLSRVELRDPRQRTTRWDAAEYRRATVFKAGSASVEARLPAEGELAEELVGAVCAEGVHEGDGADVAIGARERAAVQVAGSAGEGERAVDDADGRLTDERLRGLGLREDACDALAGAVRRRLRGEVVVDQRCRAGQYGAAGRQVDDVLCRLHPRARVRRRRAQRPHGRGRRRRSARRTPSSRRRESRRGAQWPAGARPRTTPCCCPRNAFQGRPSRRARSRRPSRAEPSRTRTARARRRRRTSPRCRARPPPATSC